MYKPLIILPFLIIYEIMCSASTQIPTSLDNLPYDLGMNDNPASNENPSEPEPPTPSRPSRPSTPTTPSRPSTSTTPSRPTPPTPSTTSIPDTETDEVIPRAREEPDENIPLPSPNENYLNIGKNERVGEYITDTRGLALYAFELDTPNESKCTGACLDRWTPLYVKSVTFPPPVAAKLDAKLVGLFERDDGKYQASYNKIPLYFFKADRRQTDIKGHKLKEFGGIWSLLSPAGSIIDNRAAGLMKNLTNIDTMNFFSTGMASMVVIPDLYKMDFNITSTQTSLSSAIKAIETRLQTFSRLSNNPPQITLTNKNVKQNGQNYEVTYQYTLTTTDPQSFSRIISAAREVAKNNFRIEFGVSDDLFYNTKNTLYEMAVNDATENANSLLNNFNLQVDTKNPIKSITIDFVNVQSIYPVINQASLTYLPSFDTATPNVASLKAEVNFNLVKKTV
jgi:predicted lipoprotein with Yx(FWY)xxD motif